MLRFLLWRSVGLVAVVLFIASTRWLLDGGPGDAVRAPTRHEGVPGRFHASDVRGISVHTTVGFLRQELLGEASAIWGSNLGGIHVIRLLIWAILASIAVLAFVRQRERRRRRYVRMRVNGYRTDTAGAEAVVSMFEALHKRLLRRWWRRLLRGQPSVGLEVHYACAPAPPELVGQAQAGLDVFPRAFSPGSAWLSVTCPEGLQDMVEAALRSAYPNCRLTFEQQLPGSPPTVLRLKKRSAFIKRAKVLDRFEHEREPAVNRLITVMGAGASAAFVQIAITPAPALFERHAKRLYKRHEAHLSRERRDHLQPRDRSMVEDSELRGGLDVQHRPLFFVDLRVIAADRDRCEQIASELRAAEAENRLVERGTAVRHGLFGMYNRRVQRGEGNPLPSIHKGVFASTELAAMWHLPSIDYSTVPFARGVLPVAPAPPAILREPSGRGSLRDAFGAVSIHPHMRKQNTAVPGTVEQGKTSYLVATVAEDLRREHCAVIVLDPKGDAAEAAVSLVPAERTCTLLDLAHPTCGFNPLAVDAPADVIADYVVAALRHLFTDADIRASSDRYLRNAIIAVLAYDRESSLWDAARLLSVGEEGYSYRSRVGARVRTLPEFKEISEFFTAELTAQLADARSMTTAKLDAPVNKLARLLNSQSIKRVLLNDSLRVDFDRVIGEREVLVVRGALGAMGAGNTSVLMQLLVGMLDAALARQQDLVPQARRVTVALKVDEAPLVLNRGFAETMALKRSAGLETVACWQTEAQWIEREVRDQLDALFAHRVYFATASVRDARAAVELTMAEFSDSVRPGIPRLSALDRPDARLHLPRHHAIASWSTPEGRQSPFVAETIPLRVDLDRVAFHATRQVERGGRYRTDLRQPHWDREERGGSRRVAPTQNGPPPAPASPPEPKAEQSARLAPSAGYRELVDLDGAHSVRWARRVEESRSLDPEPLDLEILALVASMRHLLSSQIHRHFNAERAATTTQRRLKRLSDAGWVRRFQFHRRDGGGVPMCYSITTAGLELLHAHERSTALDAVQADLSFGPSSPAARSGERLLSQARHDVHVAGWALAVADAIDHGGFSRLRGAEESVLAPPMRSTPDGRRALGPSALNLPGGRVPHEFLRTDPTGDRIQVERFETVRPDATIELSGKSRRRGGPSIDFDDARAKVDGEPVDLLVELDDRLPSGKAAGKLERYDHLLAGWAVHTTRYGRRLGAPPQVVFVCRDRSRARECARRADALLTACRAYAGEYPADWEYPGRVGIFFVAERDAHEGIRVAYGVPRLPPDVRVTVALGDPRAREPVAERRELPVVGASSE